jgi:chorismate lyase / 3-hydroxybenzoate synthase
MPSLWPEYHAHTAIPRDGVLAVVSFGEDPPPSASLSVSVPMPQLASPIAEVWLTSEPVSRGETSGVRFAKTDAVMFGTIEVSGPTEAAAHTAYTRIVQTTAAERYPHLIRLWNHVGDVNGEENGIERYKLFSAGRHDALTAHGYTRDRFPAASAVGMSRPGLVVYFVAAREPGHHVENPRQVSAYDYPPRYGVRSPSFARATVSDSLIFVAGTSSVVGHETKHPGSVSCQLGETLKNLDVIIATAADRSNAKAGLRDLTMAKVYIRRSQDYGSIARELREALPQSALLFVESDICRSDLLLEIEGVVRLS